MSTTHRIKQTKKKKREKNSLFLFDCVVAVVTHAHLELKAHDGVRGAFRTTLPTNRLTTLPAVMLGTGNDTGITS